MIKPSLIDVFYTNSLHMYQTGDFCSDISNHSFIACIHNHRCFKSTGRIITKHLLKHLNAQAFLHNITEFPWDRIKLVTTVNEAWFLSKHYFEIVIEHHASLKRLWGKDQSSPWFSHELQWYYSKRLRGVKLVSLAFCVTGLSFVDFAIMQRN